MKEILLCFNTRYPDVSDRQKMLWDAKYQTLSKQLNITEQMEKKIKGNYYRHAVKNTVVFFVNVRECCSKA